MPNCFVEGDIDDWKIVSVPVTTSQRMQDEIKNTMQLVWNKPVMVISHNTTFMKLTKLKPKEAAKVIKQGEDYAEAHTNAIKDTGTDQVDEEDVGSSD